MEKRIDNKISDKVLKKQMEKEMEIQAILMKANECKEETFLFDEEGGIETKNEISSLLDASIDDPNEKYELYYNALSKLLQQYLPKGKENGKLREYIYEEKNTFLTRGHRKKKGNVRHADSRMAYNPDLRELVDIISDWAAKDRNLYSLYTKLRDLNISKGYGKPEIEE